MKTIKLVGFISLLALFIFSSFVPVSASGNCPLWLDSTNGICLSPSDITIVSRSNSIEYRIPDIVNGRWEIVNNFNVPVPQFAFPLNLLPNTNKYRLDIVWVYLDGKGFHAISVGAKLVCDLNGSTNPQIVFSIPQNLVTTGYLENRMFDIVNLNITTKPCNYTQVSN